MKQSQIFPEQSLDQSKVRALQAEDSLVWIYYRLDNFRTQALSAFALNTIDQTFDLARERGLKIVVRFNYNSCTGSDPTPTCQDATIQIVRGHMQQLRPILVENSDVIAVVQAGMVGHWGEWHSSANLHDIDIRREIVNTWLSILPKEIMIQLRFPRYYNLFYGSPLTEAQAFTEIDKARIGIHNDCFLCEPEDGGTYRSTTAQEPKHHATFCDGQANQIECWKNFTAQQTRFTPFGGEASKLNSPRTDCPNALFEMDRMNLSFLNRGFNLDVLNNWTANGCMNDMRRLMGYRIELGSVQTPIVAKAGQQINMQVTLKNVGFASAFNERLFFVTLLGSSNRYDFEVPVDIRKLESRVQKTYDIQFIIPANATQGVYRLGFWLPDNHLSLRNKPDYSIRFGSNSGWDDALGINIIYTDFRIVP